MKIIITKKIFDENKNKTFYEMRKELNMSNNIFYLQNNSEKISIYENIKIGDFNVIEYQKNEDNFNLLNKTSSYILIESLFKNKLTLTDSSKVEENIIPNEGFIIDFDVEENISTNQFNKINKIFFKSLNYLDLLKKITGEGLFLVNASLIKNLLLVEVSGLFTNTEQKRNRIIALATSTKEELEDYKKIINDRRERDHRRLGKDLDLFIFDDKVGKGLPMWLPKGKKLKNLITAFIRKQEEKYGFEEIETPALGSIDLYKTSGHYYHYKENMFPEMKIDENETFFVRPMSCPHSVAMYSYRPRTYNELPVRYSENVHQYRYESSGSLLGLERVRSMELTDSHIYFRKDQLYSEIKNAFDIIYSTLNKFNIKVHSIDLSINDDNNQEKYHGSDAMWNESISTLKGFLQKENIKFEIKEGEAAFYGPKIDIQIKTALGHIVTVSTIQLDFLLPERFDINYIDENQKKQRPVMIHRGLIGTYERFIAILLEQTKGHLPFWISPIQLAILPVNNDLHLEYSKKIRDILKENNYRVLLDETNERLGYKIRKYQTHKINVQLVIGDDEVKNNSITYRLYGEQDSKTITIDEMLDLLYTMNND